MTKKPCSWTVVEKSRNVHELRLREPLSAGREAWTLWMSDEHWDHPKCDLRLLAEHHKEAAARGAAIVKLGDTFCVMQGKGDPRGDKGSVRPEHFGGNYLDLVVKTAADWYAPYGGNIKVVTIGNHECHDDETEILTARGWLKFVDLTTDDSVATMNMESGCTEYQHPSHIHRYRHAGEMLHLKTKFLDICVTKNHRMVYKPQRHDNWEFIEAHDSPGANMTIPVSSIASGGDWSGVTDDELRLCAWIITDGSIVTRVKKGKRYQSVLVWQRKSKCHLITEVLDRLGFEYGVKERQRDIKSVCGRLLVKAPEVECRIQLDNRQQRQRVLSLVATKERLPAWVRLLSDRQFEVFLGSLIDGDGSRHKSSPSSLMFYGKKSLLDDLQSECVTHGWRASLSVYRDSQYRLNITRHVSHKITNRLAATKVVQYDGDVWCVTVPNGTTITRRNGKVAVTGNSRIYERHETCLIDRLCQALRERGGDARKGGYSGWIRQRVGWNGTKHNSFISYYHHGFGGGGPASKGLPDFQKLAEWVDADAIISGHIHWKNCSTVERVRLNDAGNVVQSPLYFVRCSTYKNEFEDGYAGFHVENGRGPRALGGWWQRLYVRNDKVQCEWIEAN